MDDIIYEGDCPSWHQRSGILGIGGVARTLTATDYKQPMSVLIPISFARGEIVKEIDTAHCLQAEALQKESLMMNQEMTKVVMPVLTPDRVEKRQNGRRFKEDGEPEFTLTSQDIHGVGVEVKVEDVSGAMSGYEYSISDGIASSLTTSDQRKIFGSKQSRTMPCLKIQEATKQGYSEAHVGDSINLSMPDSKTRRGRVGGGCAQTLDTQCNQGTMKVIQGIVPNEEHPGMMVELAPDCHVYAVWYEKYQCYISIRKLTPKECFRLQGWDDEYFERARFVNSDSQLYKQAGNGVTVNVVYEIGKKINAG